MNSPLISLQCDEISVRDQVGREGKIRLSDGRTLHRHDDIFRVFFTFDPSDEQIQSRGRFLTEDRTRTTGIVNTPCWAGYRGHSSKSAKTMSTKVC